MKVRRQSQSEPKLGDAQQSDSDARLCPLCERPNLHPTDHHMVPRSRGGRLTTTLCRDCHHAVHAQFTNKELEAEYNTVEALMSDERFCKTVAFIKRQDPRRKTRTSRPRDKRVRGRSG